MTGIPLELQRHWTAISPLLSLRNEQEYDRAVECHNRLLDEVGTKYLDRSFCTLPLDGGGLGWG